MGKYRPYYGRNQKIFDDIDDRLAALEAAAKPAETMQTVEFVDLDGREVEASKTVTMTAGELAELRAAKKAAERDRDQWRAKAQHAAREQLAMAKERDALGAKLADLEVSLRVAAEVTVEKTQTIEDLAAEKADLERRLAEAERVGAVWINTPDLADLDAAAPAMAEQAEKARLYDLLLTHRNEVSDG